MAQWSNFFSAGKPGKLNSFCGSFRAKLSSETDKINGKTPVYHIWFKDILLCWDLPAVQEHPGHMRLTRIFNFAALAFTCTTILNFGMEVLPTNLLKSE